MAVALFLAAGPRLADLEHSAPRLSIADENLTGLVICVQRFTGRTSIAGGPALDEYGTHVFAGEDLSRLSCALALACSHFGAGPEVLSVRTGTLIEPLARDLHETVSRDRLLDVIASLQALVNEALSTGQFLHVSGE